MLEARVATIQRNSKATEIAIPFRQIPCEVHTSSHKAERLVSDRPKLKSTSGVISDLLYHVEVVLHPLHPLIEGSLRNLVEVGAVGDVDSQPIGPALA